jgi:Family of unknown function (DUF6489)
LNFVPAVDFAKSLCQHHSTGPGKFDGANLFREAAMKVNVEVDCTPEEARRFLGLPDVSKANDAYVEAVTKAMQGGVSLEQMQDYVKQLAPMGEIGMQMFRQFLDGSGLGKSGQGEGGHKKGA